MDSYLIFNTRVKTVVKNKEEKISLRSFQTKYALTFECGTNETKQVKEEIRILKVIGHRIHLMSKFNILYFW